MRGILGTPVIHAKISTDPAGGLLEHPLLVTQIKIHRDSFQKPASKPRGC